MPQEIQSYLVPSPQRGWDSDVSISTFKVTCVDCKLFFGRAGVCCRRQKASALSVAKRSDSCGSSRSIGNFIEFEAVGDSEQIQTEEDMEQYDLGLTSRATTIATTFEC